MKKVFVMALTVVLLVGITALAYGAKGKGKGKGKGPAPKVTGGVETVYLDGDA